MKNLIKVLGIIAIVAVIGFTFAACDDGNSGGGGNGTRDPKTYTGTAEGVTYTLKIEDSGARAVLTPAQGDNYTLTQTANSKTSTGKVTKVVGGVLTLAPKEDPDDEFTATVSGNNITAMSGNITWDDGTANEAPDELTQHTHSWGAWQSNATQHWKECSGCDEENGRANHSGNPCTVCGYSSGTGGGPMTWTRVADSTFGSREICAIAYGNDRFIAGGEGGKMATSPDGVTWTAAESTPFATNTIYAIAYGADRFVAASFYRMVYSSDGETWTQTADSTFDTNNNRYISGIAYGNGTFVAVGGMRGEMAYSTDNGVTWTAVADSTFGTTATDIINAIAWGGNRFVAVGTGGKMAWSPDGVRWTAVADSTFDTNNIHGIAFGNNRWVAGGEGDKKIAHSSDGVRWTAITEEVADSINAIAFGNNRFVAVCSYGTMAYSSDGISWTAVANSTFSGGGVSTFPNSINAIAFGNDTFVAGGRNGRMAYSSGTGGGDIGPGGGIIFIAEDGQRMECSGDLGSANWDNAITMARNYNGGGFTDWRLPSRSELNLMYENLHTKGLGEFSNSFYWSSSEYGSSYAWGQSFTSGTQGSSSKGTTNRVRAVRAF